jgi:hypothetical protein
MGFGMSDLERGTDELKRERAFKAIERERAHQDKKWGTIRKHPHTVGEWLLIMESELAEAKAGWCKGRGDEDALKEVLQVVSVGVACLEQHGIIERKGLGDPGVRDPDAICEEFFPGKPSETGSCEGDGHYLCEECLAKMRSDDA